MKAVSLFSKYPPRRGTRGCCIHSRATRLLQTRPTWRNRYEGRCEQLSMKGTPERQPAIYHTFNVEDVIELGHSLRSIKRMVDRALSDRSHI